MSERYRFSFTAASLQVPLMIELSSKIIDEGITPDQLEPKAVSYTHLSQMKAKFILAIPI